MKVPREFRTLKGSQTLRGLQYAFFAISLILIIITLYHLVLSICQVDAIKWPSFIYLGQLLIFLSGRHGEDRTKHKHFYCQRSALFNSSLAGASLMKLTWHMNLTLGSRFATLVWIMTLITFGYAWNIIKMERHGEDIQFLETYAFHVTVDTNIQNNQFSVHG